MATPKRPRDPNQLAKLIVDISTGQAEEQDPTKGKNAAAVALGRLGGVKGGRARAESLSQVERAAIAQKAAKVRWAKTATARGAAESALSVPKKKVKVSR
jgi:hypothetical protein